MRFLSENYHYIDSRTLQEEELNLQMLALRREDIVLTWSRKQAIQQVASYADSFEHILISGGSREIAKNFLYACGIQQEKIIAFTVYENGVAYKRSPSYQGITENNRIRFVSEALEQNGVSLQTPTSLCVVDDRLIQGHKATSYLHLLSRIPQLEKRGFAAFSTPFYSPYKASANFDSQIYVPDIEDATWDSTIARLSTITSIIHPESLSRRQLPQQTIQTALEVLSNAIENIYYQLQ